MTHLSLSGLLFTTEVQKNVGLDVIDRCRLSLLMMSQTQTPNAKWQRSCLFSCLSNVDFFFFFFNKLDHKSTQKLLWVFFSFSFSICVTRTVTPLCLGFPLTEGWSVIRGFTVQRCSCKFAVWYYLAILSMHYVLGACLWVATMQVRVFLICWILPCSWNIQAMICLWNVWLYVCVCVCVCVCV